MEPTLPPSALATGRNARMQPGLVVVFAGGEAVARSIALEEDTVELGRGPALDDGRVSRRHTRVTLAEEGFIAADLGSQNGTFVDGVQLAANGSAPLRRVSTRSLVPGDPSIHLAMDHGHANCELGCPARMGVGI